MTPAEREQKIETLRREKEAIYPNLKTTFSEMEELRNKYYKKREEYVTLKIKYESIDREEKLLYFLLKNKEVKKPIRQRITSEEKTKKEAETIMKKLSPEAIKQIMNKFK